MRYYLTTPAHKGLGPPTVARKIKMCNKIAKIAGFFYPNEKLLKSIFLKLTSFSVAPQYAQLGCEAIELVMLGAVHHDAGIQVLFEVRPRFNAA